MEGQGRSRKVKEGHGWSFPITGLSFQGRKVTGGGGVVAFRIIVSALSSGLWIWDFGPGFWTWILDLDFGLDLGLTKSRSILVWLLVFIG